MNKRREKIRMRSLPGLFKILLFLLIVPAFIQIRASSPIDITITRDSLHLQGKFYMPEGTGTFPTVILLQGSPGNENDVLGIGNKLSEVGINALTFNYSGTYKSQGEFNFDNSQKDIKSVFDFIHKSENIKKYKIDTTRIILGGYSYGGGMAFTYADNHPEVKSIFSIGGNDHGAFMEEYNRNPEMKKIIDKIFNDMKAQNEKIRYAPGGTPEEIAEMKIIESNPTYHLLKSASLLAPKDILLIGGWDDHNVSFEHIILPLYRALKNEDAKEVRIKAVQDDHSLNNSRAELAQIIIDWLISIDKEKK